ncbi:agglutinin-like ALS [Metschnikowia aff. pulcherrima]|uniref:Agglutinin-like ALS n=1 Tax=Metschnikowia aff. pulcherrima TaxID=2163413 RepID=A0A4P6XS77_9ASCO|nr:agglutinin-like ALS [Metschnikowia aff. pulcherrima]
MLCAFLLLVAAFTVAEAAVAGCSPFYTTGFGFNAKFYTYDLLSEAGWEPDFFTSGYRTTLTNTARAVTGANYQTYFLPPSAVDYNYIYGYYTTSTNFAVELSGFFRAPLSGKYTFHLNANAGASFQLGTSGTCCNDAAYSDLGDLAINTLGTTDADPDLVSYKLLAGGYYPVKIVLFNSRGNAGLQVTVKDPFGFTLPDMGLQVFQANFRNSQCGPITTGVTTVTSQWKKTYTSTTTKTGKGTNTVVVVAPKPTTTVTTIRSDSKTKTTTICGKLTDTVVVGVPTPTTTLTAVWTGLVTSTTTVAGLTKAVIVEVPKSHVTVTKTWGNSFVQTTTVEGSFTDTVIVDVPTPTTTLTSVWTESFTSSRTAVGGPGESNTVIVEVPKKTETTTRTWTGLTHSVSTISGLLTDTVVVNVPTPLVTLTSAWSNTYVSTKTISGSTNTIVVEVPKATTTITSTWTGAAAVSSTISGALTDTVIVNVPTPTTIVTSPWSQSYTSTTTALGSTNTVIVEVPKATVTSTNTWSNSFSRTSTVAGEFTDTIVVNVPKPTTTITSAWSETYTSTSTHTGATDTVVVDVPKKAVTLTSTWPNSFFLTLTFAGQLTDTIVVNVPKPTTTLTSAWLNTYTSTKTVVGPTNSVIVEVPKAITTVTRTWTDSYTTSSTAPGALTDTVIVDVPKPITTVTSAWTQSFASTTTMTGVTNTIVVEIPKATATVTNTWGNPFVSSSTISGAFTDTIVVEVPTPTQTVTSVWTGSHVTSTTVTGGPGENNTVIVEIPHSLTTTTSTWTGSNTETYTVTGSDTDTIVVEVPTPTQTVTSVWTGSYVTSTTVTGGPGENNTVIVEVPHSLTTVTRTWTGSNVETFTETGSVTDTIVVEVPTPTQTVTSVWTGSYVTSTTVTGGPGENNTVIVEVPHSLTTVTRTWTGSRTTTYILSGSVTDTIVVNDPSVQPMSSSLSESYRSVSFSVSGPSSVTGLSSRVSRIASLGQDSSSTVGSSSNPGTFASDDVPQRSLSGLGSLTVSTSFAVRLNIESLVIESESPSGPTSLPNSGVLTKSAFPSSELDASSKEFLSIISSRLMEASPTTSSKIWSTDAATSSLSQSNTELSSSYDALSSSTAWAPGFSLLLSGTSSQTRPESSGPAASSLYGSLESASGSVISSMVSLSLVMSGDLTEEISVTSDPVSSGISTFSMSGKTQYSHDVLTLSDTARTSASPVSSTTLATSDAVSSSISLDGSSTGSWKYSADHSSLTRVDSSSAAGSWTMNPSEAPVSSSALGGISSASILLSSLESLQSWAPSSDFEKLHESDPASLLIVSSGESPTSVDSSTSQETGSATVSTVTNSSSSSFGTSSGSWEQESSSTEPWSAVSDSSASTPTSSFVSSDVVESTRAAVSSADLGFTSDTSRSFMNSQLPSITKIPTRSDSKVVSSETVLSSSIGDVSSDMQSSVFSTTESTTGFTSLTESGTEIGSSFASVHTSATGPFWASSLSSLGSDASFSDQESSITSSRLVSFESRGASTSLEAISHFSDLVPPTSTTDLSSSGPSTDSRSSMLSASVCLSSTLTSASSVTLPEGGSIGSLASRASASGSVQLSNQPLISSFVDSMSGYSTGSTTESEFSSTHESTRRSSFVTVSEEPSSFKDGHASASSQLAWSDSTSIFEPTKAVPSSMISVLPSNLASSSAFASRYWNMSAQSSDFESSRVDPSFASETDLTSVHSSSQSESSKTFVVSHSSASSSIETSLTDLHSSIVSTIAVSSDASEMYASSSASSGVPISSADSEPSATSSLLESSGFSSASEPTIVPTSSSTLEIASSSVILSSYEPLSNAHSEVGTASISASSTIFEYLDSQVTESMTVSESSKDTFSDRQTSSADMLSGSEVASRSLLADALSSRLSSWMISVSGTISESAPGASFASTLESGPSSEAISTTIGSSNSFGDLDSTSTEPSRLVSEPLPGSSSSSTLQESVSTGAFFVESQSSSSIHSNVRSDTISFTSMTSPEPWHVSSTATETGFTSGDFESDKMSHLSTTKSDSELSEVSTSTHDFTLELSSIKELWSETVSDSVSVGVTFPSNGYEFSSTSTFSTSIVAPAISSGSVTSSVFSDLEVESSSFEEVPSRMGLWSSSLAASATEGASSYTGDAGLSVSGTVMSLSASSDISETTSISSSSVFSGWNASYETTTKATLSKSRPLSLSGDFTSIKSDALSSGSGNTATSVIQTTAHGPSGDGSANLTPSGSMYTSLLLTTAHSTSEATLSFSSSEPLGSEASTTIAISLSRTLSDFSRVEASPSEESSLYMTSPTASAPGERIVLSSSQISSDHLSEEVSRGSTVTSGGFSSAVISSMASMSPTSTFGSLATSSDISDSSDWLNSGVPPSSGSGSQSSIEMSSAISLSKTWPVTSATSSDWPVLLTSGLDDAASRSASRSASTSASVSSSFAESVITSGIWVSGSDSVSTTSDSVKVTSGLSGFISPSPGLLLASGSHLQLSVSTDEASRSYQPSIESGAFSNTGLNRGSFTFTGPFPPAPSQAMSLGSASSAEATLSEISWQSDAETGSSRNPSSSDAYALPSTSTAGPVTSSLGEFISSSMWSGSFVSNSGAHDAESMLSSNSGAISRESGTALATASFVGSSSVGLPSQSADATSSSEPTSYYSSSIESGSSTTTGFMTSNTAVSPDVTHSAGMSSALARSSSSQASEGLEPQSSLASEIISSWELHVSGSLAVSLQASTTELVSESDFLAEFTSTPGFPSHTFSSDTDLETFSDAASLGVSSSNLEMSSFTWTKPAPESSYFSVTSFEVGLASTSTVPWAASTSGSSDVSSFGEFSSSSRDVTIVDSALSAKWGSITQTDSPSHITSSMISSSDELPSITLSSVANLELSSEVSSSEHSTNAFTSTLLFGSLALSEHSSAFSASIPSESVTVSSFGPETNSEVLTKSASHVTDGVSISSRQSIESLETESTRTSLPDSITSMIPFVPSRFESETSSLAVSTTLDSSVFSYESESSKEFSSFSSDYLSLSHSSVELGSHSLAATFIVPSSTRLDVYVTSSTVIVGPGTSFFSTDSSMHLTSELSLKSLRTSSAVSNSESHFSSGTKESSLSSMDVATSLSSLPGSSLETRLPLYVSSATLNLDSFVTHSSVESAYSTYEYSAHSAILLLSGSSSTPLNYHESSLPNDALTSLKSASENASSASFESSSEIVPSVTSTIADTSLSAPAETLSGTMSRSVTDSDAMPETSAMSSQKFTSETYVSQGFHTDPSSVLFSESSVTFEPSIESVSSSESDPVAGSSSLVETGLILMAKPTTSTNAAFTSIDATFVKPWPSSGDDLGSSESVSLTDVTSLAGGSSSSELLQQLGVTSESELLLTSTSFDTISYTSHTRSSGSATASSSRTVNLLDLSSGSSSVVSSIIDYVASSGLASHVTTVAGPSSFATSDLENASSTFVSAVSSFDAESITRSVSHDPVLASSVISWSSSLTSSESSKHESKSSNLAEQSTASNSLPFSGSNLGSSVLSISGTEYVTATLLETNTLYTSIAASFVERGSSSIHVPSRLESKSGDSESTEKARSTFVSSAIDSFSSAHLSMVGLLAVISDLPSDVPVSVIESSYASESTIVIVPSSAPEIFSSFSATPESKISSIALSLSAGFSGLELPFVSLTLDLVSSSVSTLYTGSTLVSASHGTVLPLAESNSEATSVTKALAEDPVSRSLAASFFVPHSTVMTESSVSTTVAENDNTSEDPMFSTSQSQGETVSSSVATMTDARSKYADSLVETGSTAVSTHKPDDIASSSVILEIGLETSRISLPSPVSPSSVLSSLAIVSSPVTLSEDLPSSRLVSASESLISRTGIPTNPSASESSAILSSRNAFGSSRSLSISSVDSLVSGESGLHSSASNTVSISHGISFPTSLAASFVTQTTKLGSGSPILALSTTVSVSTEMSDNDNDSVSATMSTGQQFSSTDTYSRSMVSEKSKLATSVSADPTAASSKLLTVSSTSVIGLDGGLTSITASSVTGLSMISDHTSESERDILSSLVNPDSTLSSEQKVPFLTSVAGTFTVPSPAESGLTSNTGRASSSASILRNSLNTSVRTFFDTLSSVGSETNSERLGSSWNPEAQVLTTFALSQSLDVNQSSAKSSSQSATGVSKSVTSSMAAEVTRSARTSWETDSGLSRTTSMGRTPGSLTSGVSDAQQPPFPTSLAASFEVPSMSTMVDVKSESSRAVPSRSMRSDATDGTMTTRYLSILSGSTSSAVSDTETLTSFGGITESTGTEPIGTDSATSGVINDSASATMVSSQWADVSPSSRSESNWGAASSTMAAGSLVDSSSSITPVFSSELETRSSSLHATASLSQILLLVTSQLATSVPHSSVVSLATSSPIFGSMRTSHTTTSGSAAVSSTSQSGGSAPFVIGVPTQSTSQTSGASVAGESAGTMSRSSPVMSIVTRLTSLSSSEMTPSVEAASTSHASSSVFCYRGKCVTKSGEQPQLEIVSESAITKGTSSVSWTSSASVSSASSTSYASQASGPIPVVQLGGSAPKLSIALLAFIIPLLLIFV